jgi:hypothetical protein
LPVVLQEYLLAIMWTPWIGTSGYFIHFINCTTSVLVLVSIPFFNINVYKFTWVWAAWINIDGTLQVMYDATGVRLHAGRQAEVRSLIADSVLCFAYSLFPWQK